MSVVAVVVALALAAVGVTFWELSGTIGPKAAQGDNLSTVGPKDFSDGIGFYYLNNGAYSFLLWKKNLLTPANAPSQSDIVAAAEQAIGVKKGVRFYSYGLDYSKLGVVPPYAMGFCVVRDVNTIQGVFPIRIKPIDGPGYIYELVPPPLIDELSAGKVKHLFWAINDQYSCKEGWVFKFQ